MKCESDMDYTWVECEYLHAYKRLCYFLLSDLYRKAVHRVTPPVISTAHSCCQLSWSQLHLVLTYRHINIYIYKYIYIYIYSLSRELTGKHIQTLSCLYILFFPRTHTHPRTRTLPRTHTHSHAHIFLSHHRRHCWFFNGYTYIYYVWLPMYRCV